MNYTKLSMEEISAKLEKELTPKRYQHSLGTAEWSKKLAQLHGLNEDKAYIAGLLHDCAKCYPEEKLRHIVNDILHLEPSEFISSKTLHAPASAYIAEKEYGVEDKEILSSIRWHTIGKKNMTTFEKIIFIADKVETRTRDKDFSQTARELLKTKDGLDKAVLISYKETIKSLVERDLKICIDTIEIYNSLEDSINVN